MVNVAVRREEVVHDDEVDFPAVCHLHTMQPVELRDQGIGVLLDMAIVLGQNLSEELVFGMVDSLDDILVVARKIEEAATLAGRAQFRQNILAGQGHQVVSGVKSKFGSKMSEDPGRIVFEFKIVFRGGYQLVSGAVVVSHLQRKAINSVQSYISKENLCLA